MIVEIRDMVRKYLEDHSCHGLVEYNGDCACDLENFMPCHETKGLRDSCLAARRSSCVCGGDHKWDMIHIEETSKEIVK